MFSDSFPDKLKQYLFVERDMNELQILESDPWIEWQEYQGNDKTDIFDDLLALTELRQYKVLRSVIDEKIDDAMTEQESALWDNVHAAIESNRAVFA